MEGGKRSGSSLASELFGEKDSPKTGSSSGSIFSSIFAPPSKVPGREFVQSSETETKNSSGNPAWNPKTGVSDVNAVGGEGQNRGGTVNKDASPYYQDDKDAVHPCHYSSSIYYGGQDVYNRPPPSTHNPVFSTFNKDGGEDDPGAASRGNWWQESLYY